MPNELFTIWKERKGNSKKTSSANRKNSKTKLASTNQTTELKRQKEVHNKLHASKQPGKRPVFKPKKGTITI